MRILSALVSLLFLLTPALAKFPDNFEVALKTIAFGSCNRDELPQPVWPTLSAIKPDLWIWAGDTIYADYYRPIDGKSVEYQVNRAWVTRRYAAQFNHPDYATFRESTPILGTWDDHDYGKNNAHRDFSLKEVTRDLALSFLEVPMSDPRWIRDGLYGSYEFGPLGKRTNVILLDNRYFSTAPDANPSTILGEPQKQWLEDLLRNSSADLHLIVSGSQVISSEHRWDSWQKYPDERTWLLDLVSELKIPTVFLTGDRHMHEISVIQGDTNENPIPDITSSGLTHSWENFPGEKNSHRVGSVYTGLGFGLVHVDWQETVIEVTLEIRDPKNEVHNSFGIQFSR